MVDEDYEIISHKEIDRLKQEISKLKEAEFSGSANTIMNKLDKILEIFKEASLSMKSETITNKELNEKLDNLLDQNQKIAEGVLAVADLINNATEKEEKPEISRQAPRPNTIPHQRMVPPAPMPPNPSQMLGPRPSEMIGPNPIRQGLNPPQFPKPGMPSFNPLESSGRRPIGGLPPLPPRPPKKGLFR